MPPVAPSGYSRQQAAQQAGARAAVIWVQAELLILAALAQMIAAVVSGSLLAILAARKLQAIAAGVIAQAGKATAGIGAQAAEAVRADVQAIIAGDLGPLARLLPPVPPVTLPRLHSDLARAGQRATAVVMAEFWRITRAAQAGNGLAEAQELLDALAAAGITGLVARNGTRWDLAVYAETATELAAAEAHLSAQLRAMRDAGIALVYVQRYSPDPPCERCAPWVRKVLALSGQYAGAMVSVTTPDGLQRSVPVAGTVAEARAAGLLHPRCRDGLVPLSEGQALRQPYSDDYLHRLERAYQREQEQRASERGRRRSQREAAVRITRGRARKGAA